MIFNSHFYDNSGPQGFAVLEVVGDMGWRFVPLKKTALSGSLGGPLAEWTVTHTFSFSKRECDHPIEALYRFPLPGDAAVRKVTVRFGEIEIETTLKPRSTAEAIYEKAKEEGKSAALLSRESPDVFTLRVNGISPGEDVVITTAFVMTGRPESEGFSFRIPLTTSPRYVRQDERRFHYAKGQPLAVARNPGHRFSMTVTCMGEGTITSPTHLLTGDGPQVTLSSGEVIPDRDLVLVWKPAATGETPLCQVFTDEGKKPFILALVSPPAQSGPRVPLDVIVLVDHSGSMEGAKWEAADWAVEKFLRSLKVGDIFNLCLFHNSPFWFSRQPVAAGPDTIDQAVRFLKQKETGGTELGLTLEQALSQKRAGQDFSRHVIIITDAEVTDTGRIIQLVDSEAVRSDSRRCSVICIDSAPNSYLALQIAERSGGETAFLTSSPDEDDITTAIENVLAFWESPYSGECALDMNRPDALVDRKRVKPGPDNTSWIDLGPLPSRRSVWVAARVSEGDVPLTITCRMMGGQKVPAVMKPFPAVEALFGARLINELELLANSARSPADINKSLHALGYPKALEENGEVLVYSENQRKKIFDALRDVIVQVSLEHGIASSETAFVAVRHNGEKVVEEQVGVANALPHGWSDSFVSSGMKKSSPLPRCRKARDLASGGAILDWFGSGGGGPSNSSRKSAIDHMICQPDGTLKANGPHTSPSSFLPKSRVPGRNVIELSPKDLEFHENMAVLFDSSLPVTDDVLPPGVLIKGIECSLDPQAASPAGGSIEIYVDDPGIPRVSIPLQEFLNRTKPLNIRRAGWAYLRVVLRIDAGSNPEDFRSLKIVLRL